MAPIEPAVVIYFLTCCEQASPPSPHHPALNIPCAPHTPPPHPPQVTCFEQAAPPGGVICSQAFRDALMDRGGGPLGACLPAAASVSAGRRASRRRSTTGLDVIGALLAAQAGAGHQTTRPDGGRTYSLSSLAAMSPSVRVPPSGALHPATDQQAKGRPGGRTSLPALGTVPTTTRPPPSGALPGRASIDVASLAPSSARAHDGGPPRQSFDGGRRRPLASTSLAIDAGWAIPGSAARLLQGPSTKLPLGPATPTDAGAAWERISGLRDRELGLGSLPTAGPPPPEPPCSFPPAGGSDLGSVARRPSGVSRELSFSLSWHPMRVGAASEAHSSAQDLHDVKAAPQELDEVRRLTFPDFHSPPNFRIMAPQDSTTHKYAPFETRLPLYSITNLNAPFV